MSRREPTKNAITVVTDSPTLRAHAPGVSPKQADGHIVMTDSTSSAMAVASIVTDAPVAIVASPMTAIADISDPWLIPVMLDMGAVLDASHTSTHAKAAASVTPATTTRCTERVAPGAAVVDTERDGT